MAQTVIAGSVAKDSSPGAYILGGPVDPTTGDVRPQRGRNISGGLSSGEVILYGPDGNPLLPAAAALADGAALPTTTQVGAVLQGERQGTSLLDLIRSGDVNNVAAATGLLNALAVGRYNAIQPTLTDGRFSALQLSPNGLLRVAIGQDSNTGIQAGVVNGGTDTRPFDGYTLLQTAAIQFASNDGTGNYERIRNNTQGTLLASAARTVSTDSPIQTNWNGRGVMVFLNITAASGTGGLTVIIRWSDPLTGNVVNVFQATTAILAAGQYVYEMYPGSSAAGTAGSGLVNQRQASALPRSWIGRVLHGDASSYTYSLSFALIL